MSISAEENFLCSFIQLTLLVCIGDYWLVLAKLRLIMAPFCVVSRLKDYVCLINKTVFRLCFFSMDRI